MDCKSLSFSYPGGVVEFTNTMLLLAECCHTMLFPLSRLQLKVTSFPSTAVMFAGCWMKISSIWWTEKIRLICRCHIMRWTFFCSCVKLYAYWQYTLIKSHCESTLLLPYIVPLLCSTTSISLHTCPHNLNWSSSTHIRLYINTTGVVVSTVRDEVCETQLNARYKVIGGARAHVVLICRACWIPSFLL